MNESVRVPDGITPVVGWRSWKVSHFSSGSLYLEGMMGHWLTSGPTHAYCRSLPKPEHISGWERSHGLGPYSHFDAKSGRHVVSIGGLELLVPRAVVTGQLAVPGESCGCGLYVTFDRKTADEALYVSDLGDSGETKVLGRAALWGKVIVHETGARGEWGYPQAFYIPDKRYGALAPLLHDAYGVPTFRRSVLDNSAAPAEEVALPVATERPTFLGRFRRALAVLTESAVLEK